MSKAPYLPSPDLLEEAWRFHYLISGTPDGATRLLVETLVDCSVELSRYRNREKVRDALVTRSCRVALKQPEPAAAPDPAAAPVETLPEPGPWQGFPGLDARTRAAYATFLIEGGSAIHLHDMMRMDEPELSLLLHQARTQIASRIQWKNIDGLPLEALPELASAPVTNPPPKHWKQIIAKLAKSHPDAEALLSRQQAFDERMLGRVAEIQIPSGLEQTLREALAKTPPKRSSAGGNLFAKPVVAIGLATVVLVGVLVLVMSDNAQDFKGRETVIKLIQNSGESTQANFEFAESEAGMLEDTFFLKHGLQHFKIPDPFATRPAIGYRVYLLKDHPVAQIALANNEERLFLFRASDFQVEPPENEAWKYFENDDESAAIRVKDGVCFLVTSRGSKKDLINELTGK